MRPARCAAALAALALLGPAPAGDAAAGPVVRTDAGSVRGTAEGGLRLFRAIPYAAPPVGAHRWAAPRPAAPWQGVRDATRPGPLCPQVPNPYARISSVREDCLVLNVTAPSGGERRPVLVWIHGDGTVGGGRFFDGRRLAERGLVVVTVNYRLGVFGGFAHPGLRGSGTFGLQDQQEALRWVRRNAAAFGGDPERVTVAGSSFGAAAITGHLTAPGSRGLFRQAVLSSGEGMMDMPAATMGEGVPAYPWYTWRTVREMEQTGRETAAALGCGQPDTARALECLRAVPVGRVLGVPYVMNAFQAFAYGGEVLPELPPRALAAGRFARVPVLSGATRDEHRLFAGLMYDAAGKPLTGDGYAALLRTAFGAARAPAVRAEYPDGGSVPPAHAWAAAVTDRMWARGTFAQHLALARHVPTYAYEFADRNAPWYLPSAGPFDFGAYHAGDTPYLFEEAEARRRFTPAQARLADAMAGYWAAFARAGTPAAAGLPRWPAFDPGAGVPHTQSLAPERVGPVDYAREHRLAFWKQLEQPRGLSDPQDDGRSATPGTAPRRVAEGP
ncbi:MULTISPECIES: carboxylesterase/lipase family protein [Streptomyces]|uniref:carboxylesterase/lipase family protein n=1 Tax=Streptomyces TaxID=1883 RepID=UPI00167200AA|nr:MULTISPECIES: carboxylesterase family protein [Streptomyces]MBD3575685.1 carboxylesterase family protein [Streptomyces sp. KD18]GGT24574.1 carboxylic ester hydrolase [Streptomyces toxytricini]